MSNKKSERTARQVIAALRRRKDLLGCRIQWAVNDKNGKHFVEVLAEDNLDNRLRYIEAEKYPYKQGYLVIKSIPVKPSKLKRG